MVYMESNWIPQKLYRTIFNEKEKNRDVIGLHRKEQTKLNQVFGKLRQSETAKDGKYKIFSIIHGKEMQSNTAISSLCRKKKEL